MSADSCSPPGGGSSQESKPCYTLRCSPDRSVSFLGFAEDPQGGKQRGYGGCLTWKINDMHRTVPKPVAEIRGGLRENISATRQKGDKTREQVSWHLSRLWGEK